MRYRRFNTAKFQSTLPVWGATILLCYRRPHAIISIHAPRVGSDYRKSITLYWSTDFNPRSPCGERHRQDRNEQSTGSFQSTLPVWGATSLFLLLHTLDPDFNPRSPCGERRSPDNAPDTWRDFNPRSPCGERQVNGVTLLGNFDFNPRSPCGERRLIQYKLTRINYFNPRSPCGERLHKNSFYRVASIISIHAPRVGSDVHITATLTSGVLFQSTLPVWGATP